MAKYSSGVCVRGKWVYKLPDPFNQIPWLPVGPDEIAKHLEISYRTALRACQGESRLRSCEIQHLQIHFFGLIPHPDFIRHKFYIADGFLRTYNTPGFEASAGDITETALLGEYFRITNKELREGLAEAQRRVDELTNPPPPPSPPDNVIDFKQALSRLQAVFPHLREGD